MVVDCALYAHGVRVRTIGLDELDAVAPGEGEFVWASLHEPDPETLDRFQRRFALHELAVEDAARAHQRPKLDEYEGGAFLVVRTARWKEESRELDLGEVHAFVGAQHIVAVRHGDAWSFDELRARCEAASHLLARGPAYVLYVLLDMAVDGYFPVVDALEDEVEALEDQLFADQLDRGVSKRIYELKARLNGFKRAASPLLEVCSRLTRVDLAVVPETERVYFRDVYDHVLRVNESIDSLRELLAAALEANLALVSVGQNETMRKLAAWAAVIAIPTLVAGIYGMNFRAIPGIESELGFPGWSVTMAAACGFLLWRFKRMGWL
jgi:magnesium transporter